MSGLLYYLPGEDPQRPLAVTLQRVGELGLGYAFERRPTPPPGGRPRLDDPLGPRLERFFGIGRLVPRAAPAKRPGRRRPLGRRRRAPPLSAALDRGHWLVGCQARGGCRG